MKAEFPDAGQLFKAEYFPSLNLALEVSREQFSDMLRMLEAERLRGFHFTVEEEADGSWSVFNRGMSVALP